MRELIKIETREILGEMVQTCDARKLWEYVQSKQRFADWIKARIDKYDFVEGEDYTVHKIMNQWNQVDSIEYYLTIEAGKELAMVENNEKGREVRRYFIECERRAKAPVDPMKILSDPVAMRGLLLTYTEKVLSLESKVVELTPKAAALDLISASNDALTFTEAAKILEVKRKDLFLRLQTERWIYRRNGSWLGYDEHIKNGDLQYKEANFTNDDGMEVKKPYSHITPKGLTKLACMFSVELEAA